jgi:hypothetical protein
MPNKPLERSSKNILLERSSNLKNCQIQPRKNQKNRQKPHKNLRKNPHFFIKNTPFLILFTPIFQAHFCIILVKVSKLLV